LEYAKNHGQRTFLGLWIGTSNSSNEQVTPGAEARPVVGHGDKIADPLACFFLLFVMQEIQLLPQLLHGYSRVISAVAVGNEAVSTNGERALYTIALLAGGLRRLHRGFAMLGYPNRQQQHLLECLTSSQCLQVSGSTFLLSTSKGENLPAGPSHMAQHAKDAMQPLPLQQWFPFCAVW
jgi:hypothetical protein